MAQKMNTVVRISLSGGLIGLVTTNPRRAIDAAVDKANQEGWNCHQIVPHNSRNLLVVFLQILVLMLTLGLWTWGAGYLLLLERERA
jgi:hypothetical protein